MRLPADDLRRFAEAYRAAYGVQPAVGDVERQAMQALEGVATALKLRALAIHRSHGATLDESENKREPERPSPAL